MGGVVCGVVCGVGIAILIFSIGTVWGEIPLLTGIDDGDVLGKISNGLVSTGMLTQGRVMHPGILSPK